MGPIKNNPPPPPLYTAPHAGARTEVFRVGRLWGGNPESVTSQYTFQALPLKKHLPKWPLLKGLYFVPAGGPETRCCCCFSSLFQVIKTNGGASPRKAPIPYYCGRIGVEISSLRTAFCNNLKWHQLTNCRERLLYIVSVGRHTYFEASSGEGGQEPRYYVLGGIVNRTKCCY